MESVVRVQDPSIPAVEYIFERYLESPDLDSINDSNSSSSCIRISGLDIDIDPLCMGEHVAFNVVICRHGETDKNWMKNDIKSKSKSKSKSKENSDIKCSYDTDDTLMIDEMSKIDLEDSIDQNILDDKDSKLNDRGVSQAYLLGESLIGKNVMQILTSGMIRAIHTGRIVAEILDIHPEIDTDLHFDDKSVKNRAVRIIRSIVKIGTDLCDNSTVLLVSHNQTIDALYRACYGFDCPKTKYDNCESLEFRVEIKYDNPNLIKVRIQEIKQSRRIMQDSILSEANMSC